MSNLDSKRHFKTAKGWKCAFAGESEAFAETARLLDEARAYNKLALFKASLSA